MPDLSFQPTPKMYRMFALEDLHGRTVVHITNCPNVSNQNASICRCPKRLAFKTVDSNIGKLCAIFNEVGRTGDWNGLLHFGNLAASVVVQGCLKAVSEEQLRATQSIPPVQ